MVEKLTNNPCTGIQTDFYMKPETQHENVFLRADCLFACFQRMRYFTVTPPKSHLKIKLVAPFLVYTCAFPHFPKVVHKYLGRSLVNRRISLFSGILQTYISKHLDAFLCHKAHFPNCLQCHMHRYIKSLEFCIIVDLCSITCCLFSYNDSII